MLQMKLHHDDEDGGPQKGSSSIPASPTEPLSVRLCTIPSLVHSRTLLASDGQEFAFSPAEMDEGGVTSARSTLDADLRGHLLHTQHDALVVGRVPVGSYMHTQQQTCHLELESPTDFVLPDYQ